MKLILIAHQRFIATALSVAVISGCSSAAVKPDDLQTPDRITCVTVKEPLSVTGRYGVLNAPLTYRFERGPYWSEKVDSNGTFYRAPPGGVSVTNEDGTGSSNSTTFTFDGGFFVPRRSDEPVTIYRYFSPTKAPVEVPPSNADCSTTGYAKDPSTLRVSLVQFAVGGAIGGAAGGLVGRSIAGGSMSYGQAAGIGAAGGLIGGVIIASAINADVGKIIPERPIQDLRFMEKLRGLAEKATPIREVQLSEVEGTALGETHGQ